MGASCSKKYDAFVRISQDDSILLSKLNDDLLALILSFCATAPQRETVMDSLQIDKSFVPDRMKLRMRLNFKYQGGTSTLTHELPRVCFRFKQVCYTSDLLWTDALARSMLIEEWNLKRLLEIWECTELMRLLPNHDDETEETQVTLDDMKQNMRSLCLELSAVLSSRKGEQLPHIISIARYLYKELWMKETSTLPAYFSDARLPALARPNAIINASFIPLGDPMALRMSEPKYRIMVRELVEGRPSSELGARNALTKPHPKFLFVPPAFPAVCDPHAYVMCIKQCRINFDESADVVAVPVQLKTIVSTVERPDSEGLCDVTVVRPAG